MIEHTIVVIQFIKVFFWCSSSLYSFHFFLVSSVSTRSLLFLSFIVPIFGWNVPLIFPAFLMRSLVFPLLLFSRIFMHCSLKKVFLSLLAILWNSVFSWVYLSFSPLLFARYVGLLLSSVFCSIDPCVSFCTMPFNYCSFVVLSEVWEG